MTRKRPSHADPFDEKRYAWSPDIDYRARPDLYRVGRGQQGVLICQPYKSEILPHWRFKTEALAAKAVAKILEMFYDYLKRDEFVGADMAKKYLHMGFTRSRRYANHRDGRKWTQEDGEWKVLPRAEDHATCEKAKAAVHFYNAWQEAKSNSTYLELKKAHVRNHERKARTDSDRAVLGVG